MSFVLHEQDIWAREMEQHLDFSELKKSQCGISQLCKLRYCWGMMSTLIPKFSNSEYVAFTLLAVHQLCHQEVQVKD